MMSKTTLQILKDARELISDPKRWSRTGIARNARGNQVSPYAKDAVCWCSIGATMKVSTDQPWEINMARRALSKAVGMPVVLFNDNRGHPDVLAMFDRAISSEERRAAE